MTVLSVFFKKKQQLLGVDIGSAQIKIVELVRNRHGLFLQAYAIQPMPNDLMVDRRITDTEAVGQIIAKALKKTNFISKKAAAAVVASAAMTKVIELSSQLNDLEREAHIRLDAEKHIPYPLSEINLDFDVIAPSSHNPHSEQVLLAVSLTQNVELRADALIFAGLEPKVLDIEGYAMQRALSLVLNNLEGNYSDHLINNTALIDIGHRQLTLYVFSDTLIRYSKEQSIPLDFGDLTSSDKTASIDLLVKEIASALSFYCSTNESHLLKKQLTTLILCGGLKPKVMQCIQQQLSNSITKLKTGIDQPVNVYIANPFKNMGVSAQINPTQLKQDAASLMLACGLAMRSFDSW